MQPTRVAAKGPPAEGREDRPQRRRQLGDLQRDGLGVTLVEHHPETGEQHALGNRLHPALGELLPLLRRDVPGHQRQHARLLGVEVLAQCRDELGEVVGEPRRVLDRGRVAPGRDERRAALEEPVDALVLVLHQLDEGGELVRHSLDEPVPEQLVLDRVVVLDQAGPELDVVGDHRGSPPVPRPHPSYGGNGQPELAAEARVRDGHHPDVGQARPEQHARGRAGQLGAHCPPPRLRPGPGGRPGRSTRTCPRSVRRGR